MPQDSSHAFSAEELPETDQGQAKAGVFITPIPGIPQYITLKVTYSLYQIPRNLTKQWVNMILFFFMNLKSTTLKQ
jgi:hypothetical protein